MTEPSMSRHPDDETLAAWVQGRLPDAERAALIEHASVCAECISMIDAVNETHHAEPERPAASSGWWRWPLAAAAALLVVWSVFFVLRARQSDPLRQLVSVAPRDARPVEARLSGGFPWAPYRGTMRAGEAAADRERMKLMGAASDALERAERDASPAAQQAAAAAMVLTGHQDDAIARLTAATQRTPSNATAWNDLAAAQYAAALQGRTSLYPDALASADRALRADPQLREALFNRALILERLGLRDQARAAWQRYLDADPSSPWAAEAREHLKAVADVPPAASSERAIGEVEYLARWGEALQRNDAAEADRWLATTRNIAAKLAAQSGESLLGDAVRAIDDADAARRMQIAEGHLVYRRGRIAFSRYQLAAAERDLRHAAEIFAAANDPMSLAARSYAAGARLAQNDVAAARRELSALAAEVDRVPGYLSLAGQVRWELGRALRFDGDASGAARVFAEAEASFRRAGEAVNEASVGTQRADALIAAGRPDEAWRAQSRAFEVLGNADRTDLLHAAVSSAATTMLRLDRREAARALIAVSEALARQSADDLLLADTLVSKSLLDADTSAAQEAARVSMRITDSALRERHRADADFALAAASLRADPQQARTLATRALDLYARTGMNVLAAESNLVRARASLRLGNPGDAQRDLEAGMRAVEMHPATTAGTVVGTGMLDAGNALFEESIRLELDRGNEAAAFASGERMRGVNANVHSLDALRQRLRGSGTAVLELVALPDELVAFVIAESGVRTARRAIARDAVIARVASGDDAALYELLIHPVESTLREARALIVVPDAALDGVSFAALRDAQGRPLVEALPVSIARNAIGLQPAPSAIAPSAVATIALPSAHQAPLPEVDGELSAIGSFYPAARRVDRVEQYAGGADVLHIAGHTSIDAGGQDALAASDAPVSWSEIAAMRRMPPVVVLSACNTLRGERSRDRRALSLAGAFLAAGATDVVGTLAPIGDKDARSLFSALHEQLADGVAAPAALRRVQLDRLRQSGEAWRRLAVLTTTIHRMN